MCVEIERERDVENANSFFAYFFLHRFFNSRLFVLTFWYWAYIPYHATKYICYILQGFSPFLQKNTQEQQQQNEWKHLLCSLSLFSSLLLPLKKLCIFLHSLACREKRGKGSIQNGFTRLQHSPSPRHTARLSECISNKIHLIIVSRHRRLKLTHTDSHKVQKAMPSYHITFYMLPHIWSILRWLETGIQWSFFSMSSLSVHHLKSQSVA